MVLVLYNSLGRKLAKVEPVSGKKMTVYACGPTVHNYAHIGNFRTFVFVDMLRRYLAYKGYEVEHVMNITDVEDRIIDGIKRTGMGRKELTDFYTKAFMDDLESLNVKPADHYPRATENIDEMVKAIQSLISKGYAYEKDGSVYFSIKKFKRYGELSGIRPEEGKKGARTADDHYEKAGANDFALWKAWDPDDGEVFWETPLGKGRPGWHIECSVMSMKYLGETLDIHLGGLDLRFPHHENEIAQSEALTGKKFVRHWEHSAMLTLEGGKMSKSLGNIVTLRDLLERGTPHRAIRLFLITAHYRDELKLTDKSIQQAVATLAGFDQLVRRLRSANGASDGEQARLLSEGLLSRFEEHLDADFGVPAALAALSTFQRKVNSLLDSGAVSTKDARSLLEALEKVDSVFGFLQLGEEEEDSPLIDELVARRELARKRRDFAESDRLRSELERQGVVVEDTPQGPVWHRVSTPP